MRVAEIVLRPRNSVVQGRQYGQAPIFVKQPIGHAGGARGHFERIE